MLFLLLVANAKAACEARTTTADLVGAMRAAEASYVAMDLDSFRSATAQANAILPCLSEVLTPVDVAAYHRMEGLDAYAAQDTIRTMSAFVAATAIQPGFALPSTIAPAGNPLDAIYQLAKSQIPAIPETLSPPAGTLVYVDGDRGTARSTKREAVLQLASMGGEVLWTGLVAADTPAPDWSAFGQAVAAADVGMETSTTHKRKPTIPLAIGAGGLALGSGALYGLAAMSRARFDDPATSMDTIEGLRSTTNAEVYGSIGAGVLALGLGALAAVSVTW